MSDLRAKVPRTGGSWFCGYAVLFFGDRKSRLELLSGGGRILSRFKESG